MSTKSRTILAWVFGIFILLMSLSALTRQPVAGLMIAAAGVLLLPPVARRLSDKLARKWRITLVVILFLIGTGASGSSQQLQEQKVAQQNTPTTEAAPVPVQVAVAVSSRARAPFVYDIPMLFEKKYPQIKAMFGKIVETDPYGDEKTEVWFTKKGFDLGVDYNPKTNDVIGFFLSPDETTGSTKDIDHLMDIGNLSTNDPHYTVEPVPVLNDPSSYTGIKIQTAAAAQAGVERAKIVKDAEQYNVYATVCAQQEVTAMLKAPSTAKFPWGSADTVLYSPEKKSFDVISYVDAENSYGAMMRTKYVCTVADHHDTNMCDAQCQLQ
jgi:hypothetical protein